MTTPPPDSPTLWLQDMEVFAVGPFEHEDEPGILFRTGRFPRQAVFLLDAEAVALRDWLIARYGAPTP